MILAIKLLNISKLFLNKNLNLTIYSTYGGDMYIKFQLNRGIGKKRLHFFYLGTVYYLFLKPKNLFFIMKSSIPNFIKSILLRSISYSLPTQVTMQIKGYGLEFFLYKKLWLVARIHRKSKVGLTFLKIPVGLKLQFLESPDTFRRSKIRICSYNYYLLGWFIRQVKSIKKPEVYTGKGIFFKSEKFTKKIGKVNSYL